MWAEIPLIWVYKRVIYYTYLYLFHVGIENARNAIKIEKSWFRYKKNTWYVKSNYVYSLQNIWLLLWINLDILTTIYHW